MALALDGIAQLDGSSGSSGQVTLTTAFAGRIGVAITSNGAAVTSINDSVALSYTKRGDAGGASDEFSYWVAPSGGAQISNIITVNLNASASYLTIHAFGVEDADDFDPNGALPSQGITDPRSISTDTAIAFLIHAARASVGAPDPAAGWTTVTTGGFTAVQYKIVSATQSGLSVSTGSGTANGAVADAFIAAAAPADGPSGGLIRNISIGEMQAYGAGRVM